MNSISTSTRRPRGGKEAHRAIAAFVLIAFPLAALGRAGRHPWPGIQQPAGSTVHALSRFRRLQFHRHLGQQRVQHARCDAGL